MESCCLVQSHLLLKVEGEKKICDLIKVYSKLPGKKKERDVAFQMETATGTQAAQSSDLSFNHCVPIDPQCPYKSCSDRKGVTRKELCKSHAN